MPKITTIAQMRALEAQANAAGVSYESIMERAGTAVAAAIGPAWAAWMACRCRCSWGPATMATMGW